jgi:hypothetical protein
MSQKSDVSIASDCIDEFAIAYKQISEIYKEEIEPKLNALKLGYAVLSEQEWEEVCIYAEKKIEEVKKRGGNYEEIEAIALSLNTMLAAAAERQCTLVISINTDQFFMKKKNDVSVEVISKPSTEYGKAIRIEIRD